MDLSPLIQILSSGKCYSGVELGQKLNKSRTAIWKMMPRLEDLGIELKSIKGKGYCVQGGLDLLPVDKSHILPVDLIDRVPSFKVLLSVDSTNTYVSKLMSEGSPRPGDYVMVFAEHQIGGRGRRGRAWQSPFGKNLYFSLGFRFPGDVSALSGLSLVVGISLAQALRDLGVVGAGVKWPNDVLINGRKVAGILIELAGEISSDCQVVVGVGLNVHMDESADIDQPWTSISREGLRITKKQVAEQLVRTVTSDIDVFLKMGFSAFIERWNEVDCLVGKSIAINAGESFGIAQGVNDRGELFVETQEGVLSVNAGEVSVRVSNTSV